jgi:hypothetical protein
LRSGIFPYLAFSFGVAWACWGLCWLIVNRHLSLPLIDVAILGSFGPFIAAGNCVWSTDGVTSVPRFYARALNPRMGWLVFVVAVFLVPALAIIAALIFARQFHQAFAFQMAWGQVPMDYIWLFFLGGAVNEEFGWSYLSDRLDEHFSPGFATLLLGTIWGFWHLPLFFLNIPGLVQRYLPFYAFLFSAICLRLLFSWAYHKANRNILSNLLIHNSFNFAISIVIIVPQASERFPWRFWYLAILSAASAFILQRLAPAQVLPRKIN